MSTCGGCFHYKKGRCKNRSAATYSQSYPAKSTGCQMHMTNILSPFAIGLKGVFLVVYPITLVILALCGKSISPNSNNKDGFSI